MQAMVEHAHQANGSGVAAALSLVLLLVGASATFSSLNTALDSFQGRTAQGHFRTRVAFARAIDLNWLRDGVWFPASGLTGT